MTRLPGRILAIDYGTVRLGLAVSDAGQTFASPFRNYTRVSPEADAQYLSRVVAEEEIVQLVVGLPVHLDGRESQKSRESRAFGTWLAETIGLPVTYYDERLTTREAEDQMRASKLTRKQRQERRDMLAAQLLLAAYLEADPTSNMDQPSGLE